MPDRQLLRLYFTVFVASIGLGAYIYFVPVFAQTFGATFLDLGLIGSSTALTYAITPVLVSYLSDKFHRGWLFTLGLAINAIATIVLIASHSVGAILLLRLLGGFGYGFFWPSAEVLVTDLAPVEKRVKEMGFYSVAWASGFLLGPLMGGVIVQGFGFIRLFMVSAFIISLSAVLAFLWVIPGYQRKFVMQADFSSSLPTIRRLISWYLMTLCYGIVFSVVAAIFPGYANSVGLSPAIIGLLFTAFGIARIAFFATIERHLMFGERRVLLIGASVLAIGVVSIGVFPSFVGFFVALVLIGGSFGVIFPLTISLISRHFPNEKLGAAIGSYETVFGIGFVIGPILAGIVASVANVALTFVLTGFFGVLMTLFVITGRTSVVPFGPESNPDSDQRKRRS